MRKNNKCTGKVCGPDGKGRPRACNPETGRCKLIDPTIRNAALSLVMQQSSIGTSRSHAKNLGTLSMASTLLYRNGARNRAWAAKQKIVDASLRQRSLQMVRKCIQSAKDGEIDDIKITIKRPPGIPEHNYNKEDLENAFGMYEDDWMNYTGPQEMVMRIAYDGDDTITLDWEEPVHIPHYGTYSDSVDAIFNVFATYVRKHKYVIKEISFYSYLSRSRNKMSFAF